MNTRQTIGEELNELRKSAPIFSSVPRKNCFAVPEGYFDELPAVIVEKQVAITHPVVEGALSAISKANPFNVPAGYFDDLPRRVAGQINRQIPEIQPVRVPALILRPVYAIAAVLIGLLFMVTATVYVYRNFYSPNDKQFTEISHEEIVNSDIIYDIDDALIIENISEPADLNEDAKEAEEYLIQNNVDLTTLVNEL